MHTKYLMGFILTITLGTMSMAAAQGPGVTREQLEELLYADNIPGFWLVGQGKAS